MCRILFGFFLTLLFVIPSQASDHNDYVSGSYTDARSVTEDCLSCHREQGDDFMKTAHWLWKGPTPFVVGHEDEMELGKHSVHPGIQRSDWQDARSTIWLDWG